MAFLSFFCLLVVLLALVVAAAPRLADGARHLAVAEAVEQRRHVLDAPWVRREEVEDKTFKTLFEMLAKRVYVRVILDA